MNQAETTSTPLPSPPLARAERAPSYRRATWRRLRKDTMSMVALALLTVICLLAATAPLLTEHLLHTDPNKGRLTQKFQPPSKDHLLGTDDYGRDTLTRLLYASRVSLYIGFLVAAVSLTIGVSVGLAAGYFGGKVDDAVNAVIQLVANIPSFFLLITLSALFRPSVSALALILAALGWTGIARQVRGRVFSERRRDYVDAAIVAGASTGSILYRHILPNVSSIILVLAGFDIGGAILTEAGLSALGLGVQIPTPSWGNMLSKSFDYFTSAWWLVLTPGLMIFLTVFSVFQLGDGLRDALDPRQKR